MCFSTSRKVAPRVDIGFVPPRLWVTSGLPTILESASRLQMGACGATEGLVTLTKQSKIGPCEQVRVN